MIKISIPKSFFILAVPVVSVASWAVSYSPNLDGSYPTDVYWGDTHLHTNLSMDAYTLGNKDLGPEEAYRFAKGETVTAHNGLQARLQRPLDFLVIADHAINMGVVNAVEEKSPDILKTERGKRWAKLMKAINQTEKADPNKFLKLLVELSTDGWDNGHVGDRKFRRSVWEGASVLADKHNAPGLFTAFIGYEWTGPFNLHRVVVFKDDANKAGKVLPLEAHNNGDPEALWAYMQAYETETSGEVLAIPHNSNRSSGVMFALEDAKGMPLDSAYAKQRSRWEPLLEVTQIKGDSETHPAVSPSDEFADYETMAEENMSPKSLAALRSRGYKDYQSWYDQRRRTEKKTDWMRQYEYARPALKLGLSQQAKLGINPFKFGMAGGTDSHTSLATADDNNFWGKLASNEPHNLRISQPWHPLLKGFGALSNGWSMTASGYTAIWAKENTRESLFAAMKRKEVYATTGPRMRVRFFGGWNYKQDDAYRPDLVRTGYLKGVPMGGDLTHSPKNSAPAFLIRAVKDPDGANLDRVQLIKGWLDQGGDLHEKIYNVALSDGRKDRGGHTQAVGNTVDVTNAIYTNTIGDPELAVVWTDPDFHPDELAFYYLRVLEIPTPRWTAYDAKHFGIKDIPEEVPLITQERAYTSPIWYTPSSTVGKGNTVQ